MNDPKSTDAWRQRPWAIVLLFLVAIAFGIQLAMGGEPFLMVSTGVMLASGVALLLMSMRRK